ncbi:uncharacterized protein LOC123485675 [Coregonus clupeaformis]|uniref:uncharacterized protein LOC123485675 n=1 Tax=Coregonus clupeaformis TaxID=59861 RepID=UPI001E1C5E15|nr:uncharacterized protein LOC123485675 [Coregonus clupeaformis]
MSLCCTSTFTTHSSSWRASCLSAAPPPSLHTAPLGGHHVSLLHLHLHYTQLLLEGIMSLCCTSTFTTHSSSWRASCLSAAPPPSLHTAPPGGHHVSLLHLHLHYTQLLLEGITAAPPPPLHTAPLGGHHVSLLHLHLHYTQLLLEGIMSLCCTSTFTTHSSSWRASCLSAAPPPSLHTAPLGGHHVSLLHLHLHYTQLLLEGIMSLCCTSTSTTHSSSWRASLDCGICSVCCLNFCLDCSIEARLSWKCLNSSISVWTVSHCCLRSLNSIISTSSRERQFWIRFTDNVSVVLTAATGEGGSDVLWESCFGSCRRC